MSNTTTRDLIDIDTNEVIRKATEGEALASDEAGHTGALHVEIDGEDRTCYVDA